MVSCRRGVWCTGGTRARSRAVRNRNSGSGLDCLRFPQVGAGAVRRRFCAGARRHSASRCVFPDRVTAPETRGLAAGSPWPCDYGPDLSRGFRALKTWFTIRVYGAQRLGAVISRTCAVARYLEGRVRAEARLELLAPAQLNIVCFRYRCLDANAVNAAIAADLHESGIAAPSTTVINEQVAIRAAIVNHRTQPCDIDSLLEATLRFGDAASARIRSGEPTTITTESLHR